MICYQKTKGLARDLRFVPDGYVAQPGDFILEGDVLPALESLNDPVPPSVALQLAASSAAEAIDAKAGQVRERYITSTAGQDATYLLKSFAAQAFKDAGYVGIVPAMVQAEADATARTAQQAADDILAQQAAWIVKGAQIEKARRAGKIAAAAAIDVAGVQAAQAAALKALDVL